MSRRRSKRLPETPGTLTCCFCGFSEDDEVEYGKLWNQDGIVTHYYCLLLSSNMEQNGNDNEGILGFLTTDIQKELRRGKRLSCSYCKRNGATLGCCNTRCKQVFHLPCGLRAGSLHQFFGEFRSYCIRHRIKQNIDEYIKEEAAATGDITCYICYEEVNPQNPIRTLWAPCCRKNAWFHRKCVQRLALSAGYFFKCPLCNNKPEFQQAMLDHGIFIPNQDASWELVPNAFQELLHRHNQCDAPECLCPKGRSHTSVNAKWELVLCRLCGSQGVHKSCGQLKWGSSVWECTECTGMLKKSNDPIPSDGNEPKESMDQYSNESSSDSEISVGGNTTPPPISKHDVSPSPTPPPFRLRPGPKSFKLQQASRNMRSLQLMTTATSMTFLPSKHDISLSSASNAGTNTIPDTKSISETMHSRTCPSKEVLTSTDHEFSKLNVVSSQTSVLSKIINVKPEDPSCHTADIIVIDSDDEVEIIDVTPKPNGSVTTKRIQIESRNLSEVTTNIQKIRKNSKVTKTRRSEPLEILNSPPKTSPRANGLIAPHSSSVSNTTDTTSTTTPISNNNTANVMKPLIDSMNTTSIAKKKLNGSKDADLIVDDKVLQENPAFNLKITNVTSLRPEYYENPSTAVNVEKITHDASLTFAESVQGDIPSLNGNQQLEVVQNQMIEVPKPQLTFIQLNTSSISGSNLKRKSDEYTIDNPASILPIIEDPEISRKKARIDDCNDSTLKPQTRNISWNINSNDISRAVPVVATSIPMSHSTSSYSSQQSTTTLQVNMNGTQANKSCVRLIRRMDVEQRNGFCNYTSGTVGSSSVQNQSHVNINHIIIPNTMNSPIRIQLNSTSTSDLIKVSNSSQPELGVQHSVSSITECSDSIRNTTCHSFKSSVNELQNSPETSSTSINSQLFAHLPNSDEIIAPKTYTVHQSHQKIRQAKTQQNAITLNGQTNPPTPDRTSYNGLTRTNSDGLATSNENESVANAMMKIRNPVTQLGNGGLMTSGCDGDAGSSPAAEAGFALYSSSRTANHTKSEAIAFKQKTSAISDSAKRVNHNSSISSTTRKYCNKPRVIPQKVPLQNLKFHVLDEDIVQIVINDTFTVNLSTNAGNPLEAKYVPDPMSLLEKQGLLLSSMQPNYSPRPSSSSSSKPLDTEKSSTVSISKKCQSSLGNIDDLVAPECASESEETSVIAATTKGSNSIVSCDTKGKYSIQKNVPDGNEKQTSLSDDMNKSYIQKTGFSVSGCLNGNKLNFMHTRCTPKSLCESEDHVIFHERRKHCSESDEKSSMKRFEDRSGTEGGSNIDSRQRPNNILNGNRWFNGLNRGSMCLVESSNESSELKLPVVCDNSFKLIDSSSHVYHSIDNLDASVQKSGISIDNNVVHSHVNDWSNKFSVNTKVEESSKYCDDLNSDKRQVEALDTNYQLISDDGLDISMKKQKCNILKNPITLRKDRNMHKYGGKMCRAGLGIKVEIDLGKIKNLIVSRPQLFNKCKNHSKTERKDEQLSEIVQTSVRSQSFRDLDPEKCSQVSIMQTSPTDENVDTLNIRRKFST
ncbi:uncharacterized protein LOC124408534 isoform X2 [Diprion similis]|uniref:uncharacterized protein LOC124408534 isoform X2 n=1 Tax=Diprion similis TaxID=362088 RepID=UPI001EF7545F|nr:uncharacterized protein LOC124408534 isoform X2 [Diprion similis]